MSKKTLLFMMLCNFIPVLHLVSSIFIFISLPATMGYKTLVSVSFFYLFPPIITRLITMLFPIKDWKVKTNSRDYHIWWLTFNLQVIFSRFSFTEELLRVIPMLYSNWLRLWGAKIGKFTYWSPNVVISDRSFLNIGDNVVIGAGARLISHLLLKDNDETPQLLLKEITIESDVILGGYSVVAPGVKISKGISTRAFFITKPLTRVTKNTTSEEF